MKNDLIIKEYDGNKEEWDQYAELHPKTKFYHLFSWKEIIEKTFGHQTMYLAAYRGEAIVGVLPLVLFKSRLFGKFLISMPFLNYGGALVDSPDVADAFHQHVRKIVLDLRLDFAELRMEESMNGNLPGKEHKVTFLLSLPDSDEELLKGFKAKVRSQVRRPMKEKMNFRNGGIELLDQFYRVFALNMKDLGTPVYPKSFFKNILETFPENSFITCVYTDEGKPVAASFLHGFKDTVEIPWASSLREYNRFSPNMLLYWGSFVGSIERGYATFDFGRCSPEGGTYRFKKQWGAEEKQLYWYYILPNGSELPEINPDNPKYELAIKTWQKLPLGITKFLGPKIIKNIP